MVVEKIKTGDLQSSTLKGVTCSAISSLITYYGLKAWVVMTISLGPVDKIYATINTAVIFAAVLTFLSAFLSSYIKL